jgi:hypothetical protein
MSEDPGIRRQPPADGRKTRPDQPGSRSSRTRFRPTRSGKRPFAIDDEVCHICATIHAAGRPGSHEVGVQVVPGHRGGGQTADSESGSVSPHGGVRVRPGRRPPAIDARMRPRGGHGIPAGFAGRKGRPAPPLTVRRGCGTPDGAVFAQVHPARHRPALNRNLPADPGLERPASHDAPSAPGDGGPSTQDRHRPDRGGTPRFPKAPTA